MEVALDLIVDGPLPWCVPRRLCSGPVLPALAAHGMMERWNMKNRPCMDRGRPGHGRYDAHGPRLRSLRSDARCAIWEAAASRDTCPQVDACISWHGAVAARAHGSIEQLNAPSPARHVRYCGEELGILKGAAESDSGSDSDWPDPSGIDARSSPPDDD